MTSPSAPPQLSPDGHWWWDGTEWVPADRRPAPVAEQPVVEQPVVEQPVVEQPVVEQPVVEQPVVEQPGFYATPAQAAVPAQPQAYGTYPAAPASGTDGLAIASLVLSLVWLGGLGSVGGIVTGHLSRSKAKSEGRQPSGLALAGLILGYVGASFFALGILAAIAIPVFLNQREAGTAAEVKSNLRNAAVAEETFLTAQGSYAQDTGTLGFTPSDGVEVVVLGAGATDYCLGARKLTQVFYYDSRTGGLSTSPCSRPA